MERFWVTSEKEWNALGRDWNRLIGGSGGRREGPSKVVMSVHGTILARTFVAVKYLAVARCGVRKGVMGPLDVGTWRDGGRGSIRLGQPGTIAATALRLTCPLASDDGGFDGFPVCAYFERPGHNHPCQAQRAQLPRGIQRLLLERLGCSFLSPRRQSVAGTGMSAMSLPGPPCTT